MGLWSWLRGISSSPHAAIDLPGQGLFAVNVVGEANYQEALAAICGGKSIEGHKLETEATLILEDDNEHDPQAVRVEIDGRTVGYLSRHSAPIYRARLSETGRRRSRARCAALIVGGWDRGEGDEGHFGVKLDLPIG